MQFDNCQSAVHQFNIFALTLQMESYGSTVIAVDLLPQMLQMNSSMAAEVAVAERRYLNYLKKMF